jgi:hypothetical protein
MGVWKIVTIAKHLDMQFGGVRLEGNKNRIRKKLKLAIAVLRGRERF